MLSILPDSEHTVYNYIAELAFYPTVCGFSSLNKGPPWPSSSALDSESRDQYCSGASFIKISPH